MKLITTIILGLAAMNGAASEQGSSKLIRSVVKAEPIERPSPKYPRSALKERYEGWVELSYVIEEDGSVSNTIITDSSGLKSFERAARNAVEQWQFSPATSEGKPIQQCNTKVVLSFSMKQDPAVHRQFRAKYKGATDALQNQKLEKAAEILSKMAEKPRKNLYEEALFWDLYGNYYLNINDKAKALESYKRAANVAGATEDKHLPLRVNSQLFRLYLTYNRLAEARNVYKRISKIKGNEQLLKELSPLKEKIDAVINSDNNIAAQLIINERGIANYRLTRSDFQLADVNGKVDSIEVYCDNKRNKFTYEADSAWHIPPSWGSCTLYIRGQQDTAFSVLELAKQS